MRYLLAIYRFIFGQRWEPDPVILALEVKCQTCGEVFVAGFRGKRDKALCNGCWSWVGRSQS